MMGTGFNIRAVEELVLNGYTIIWLPLTGRYYYISNHVFCNKSDHIHINTIKGRDVTDIINNFAATFSDKQFMNTTIMNRREIEIQFPEHTDFLYFC